jgi:hypothetical protein
MRGALRAGVGVGEMSTRLGGVAIADQSNAKQDGARRDLISSAMKQTKSPPEAGLFIF